MPESRRAARTIVTVLAELVEYTQKPFKDEEDAMHRDGYPGLAEQQEQHQALIEQVAATQEKLSSGNAMLSIEVMEFLKAWLVKHIQGSDKAYGDFLAARRSA